MSPATSRDFQKAASQRLTTAKFLLDSKYTLDAMYITGYAIECSLKALILARTPAAVFPVQFEALTKGAKMHNFENLAAILRDPGDGTARANNETNPQVDLVHKPAIRIRTRGYR
jgi:hypothetical protein